MSQDRLPDRFGAVQLAKENAIPAVAKQTKDPFWEVAEIDEARWDQYFPFQLLYLKHDGQGRYSRVANGTYTLPIPPQSLSESMPFAIPVSATLGGIVEEHNGVPFVNFSLQGTTGVLPGRGAGKLTASFSAAESIFAGTVRAFQNFQNSVAPLTAGQGFRPNNITDAEIAGDLKGTTGYYQFLLLKQFLRAYANLKKTKTGRDYRLGFAHWKTKEVYLVTPVTLDVQKAAGSPLKFNFTLQLRAWRQINLNQGAKSFPVALPITRQPGALQTLLTNITQARGALSKLTDVLDAVGQDINAVLFEPLRSTALFVKDLMGLPLTAADLPVNIVRDMKGAILQAAGVGAAVNGVGSEFSNLGSRLGAEFNDLSKQLQDLSVMTGKAETGAGELSSKGAPLTAVDSRNPDPANKILENPQDNFELFDKVQPGALNLSPSTTRKIVEERERVQKLNRLDFEKMRDDIQALLVEFSDVVGAGNGTYSRIYGREAPVSTRTPTSSDHDAIFNLNQVVLEMNRLAASGDVGDRGKLNAIEYIAGLAGRSGIGFEIPLSQRQVPFPYGSTLEQVAARYLNDPDRWHEIAALNRLRAPYVDEEGFDLTLLVNGSGNKVVVNNAERLFVGQPVWLSSSTVSRIKRRITGIDPVSESNIVVTLDGDPDLDRFTTVAAAYLHAYLPDTVNSQMLISIPSSTPADEEDFQAKAIPGLDDYQHLLEVGGIDLMVTAAGDAAITDDGDWKLAVGMQNLVQYARIFVQTPKNSMPRHPNWGLPIQVGQSTADASAQDILDSVQSLAEFNPAFTGIKGAAVRKRGPATEIQASFEVAGSNFLLPITFEIKR